MSDVQASIILADFVNIDAGGKVNVLGGGVTLLGWTGQLTTPFAIFVRLSTPRPIHDAPAVEILLADASGNPVMVPSGPDGESQAMRIAQNVEFSAPAVPGVHIPPGAIASTAQIVLNFGNGLPLKPGHSYTWRVQIDHDVIASESFYIPTGPAMPVIG